MSKKEEVKQGEVKAPVEGQDFKKYEYADVFFECNRCGHMTVLDKGVEDGLSFVLPATDKHEWRMVCDNCKNMMRIFFRASSNETIDAAKLEKKKKLAEEKAKAEQNKEDESNKENRTKKSRKRNSKDSEGTLDANAKGRGSDDAVNEAG